LPVVFSLQNYGALSPIHTTRSNGPSERAVRTARSNGPKK